MLKRFSKKRIEAHLKKTWCISKVDASFLARMEALLWLYDQPHDPNVPGVCFDERPCFLIGQVLDPLPLTTGQVTKEHDAYTKHGSCALLAAIEPLTGKRLAEIYPRRTMKEDTQFCQALTQHWPQAEKIRLVQDNLNTHTRHAFYRSLLSVRDSKTAQRVSILVLMEVKREQGRREVIQAWQRRFQSLF